MAQSKREKAMWAGHKWNNSASTGLKSQLIKNAMESQHGVHYDTSKAVKSWNNQPLEKLPVSLKNSIAIELMFGSPKLRNEFWGKQ